MSGFTLAVPLWKIMCRCRFASSTWTQAVTGTALEYRRRAHATAASRHSRNSVERASSRFASTSFRWAARRSAAGILARSASDTCAHALCGYEATIASTTGTSHFLFIIPVPHRFGTITRSHCCVNSRAQVSKLWGCMPKPATNSGSAGERPFPALKCRRYVPPPKRISSPISSVTFGRSLPLATRAAKPLSETNCAPDVVLPGPVPRDFGCSLPIEYPLLGVHQAGRPWRTAFYFRVRYLTSVPKASAPGRSFSTPAHTQLRRRTSDLVRLSSVVTSVHVVQRARCTR